MNPISNMRFALWRDRLALLILALLPWQARYIRQTAALYGAPWEQGTASVFALEVLLLLALGCHFLAAVSRREPKKAGAPLWLQVSALLPIYAFVSVAWAYDTIGALYGAIHLFEGYALAYLLWVSGVSLASALAALIAGAAASCALGLWQFFTQSSFASTLLGIASHPAAEAGTSVVETGAGRFLRAYGSLPHPNILGGYVAAGLLAALALASEARRFRKALLAAAVVLGAGLAASFSRSAWLAFATAIAAAAAFPRVTSNRSAWFRLLPVLAAVASGILLVAFSATPIFATRLSAHGRLETKSIDERSTSVRQGFGMLERHFEIGTGIGNYLPTFFLTADRSLDPFRVQPPHFVPFLVGAELGFFGLAVLLGFVASWWVGTLWIMRRTSSPMSAWTAVLPVVVIVASCFDHYPFDLFAGTMLTGALFGLSLKAGERSEA